MSVVSAVAKVVAAARHLMPAAAAAGLSVSDLDAALRSLDAQVGRRGSTECVRRGGGLRVYESDMVVGRDYILFLDGSERQFRFLGYSDNLGAMRVRLVDGSCVDWFFADCGLSPNREGARDAWWSEAWVMELNPSDERLGTLVSQNSLEELLLSDDSDCVL